MASAKKLLRSFFWLILPVIVLLLVAATGASVWLLRQASNPPKSAYLVTPEKFVGLSTRGGKITDETWTNKDGSSARGWLLRGKEGSPGIILLHRYGADRSYVLNLGVKLNEITNFTILMPDMRGHGENPNIAQTSFGGCETDDTIAAIEFLRSLKSEEQKELTSKEIGIYGLELGAYSALSAAALDPNIKVLALDSVPVLSDDLLGSVIEKRYPFASFITAEIAKKGTYFVGQSCYKRTSLCDLAGSVRDRKVLLLGGIDVPSFQNSTQSLGKCFTFQVESKTDLGISGFSTIGATGEQAEAYDQRVIEFFKKSFSDNL